MSKLPETEESIAVAIAALIEAAKRVGWYDYGEQNEGYFDHDVKKKLAAELEEKGRALIALFERRSFP